jgi:hypothetical protein
MLEFLNNIVIKSTNIYFDYKDKVYVISKQLIVDVFRVHAKGYENPKVQVSKTVALHALQVIELNP